LKNYFKTCLKQHFIYNTLNCAVSLCRKKPKEASELLIDLSDCLHYTSDNNSDLVSLKEEIDFVCSYLYVQSIRFSPRIELNCDTGNMISCNIARFLIYRYVDDILENVLKNTNDNITFKISVNPKEQKAVVEVFLNGKYKYIKEFS